MIRRIKLLKQYGVFANFDKGNALEFGQITVIHGFNTFGKSTLCDLFKSLNSDDSKVIAKRTTIPHDEAKQQQIVLSVGRDKEETIRFSDSRWENNVLKGKLQIFDTEFVYNNIFDGVSLLQDRDTKESFTDFILGDESVETARKLEEKRREVAEKKKRQKQCVPGYVKNKSHDEIMMFVNQKVTERQYEVEERLLEARSTLNLLEQRKENSQELLSMAEPEPIAEPCGDSMITAIDECNRLLRKSFDSIGDDVLERVRLHANSHLGGLSGAEAEAWIRTGTVHGVRESDSKCPFCGQPLDDAQGLIRIYQEYFSKDYKDFCDAIENGLDGLLEKVFFEAKAGTQFSESLLKLSPYVAQIDSESLSVLFADLQSLRDELIGVEQQISDTTLSTQRLLAEQITKKKTAPHRGLSGVPTTLKATLTIYAELIAKANNLIRRALTYIEEFKRPYQEGSIDETIETLKKDINEFEMRQKRLEQDDDCREYASLHVDIKAAELDATELSTQLESGEQEFLDRCFQQIDALFSELGSRNFSIRRSKASDRGFKKVYGIEVLYKDKPIKNADLQYVFSESDRRALAMSVFLAKLYLIDQDEKSEIIVVLDDPCTSFDENRISKICGLLWEWKGDFSQVLILSHYQNFLKHVHTRFNGVSGKCVFIDIKQNSMTSSLSPLDIDAFTSSDDEKACAKIMDFIDRRTDEDITAKLRVHLEARLKTIFYKAYVEHDLARYSLERRIDLLYELGLVDQCTAEYLHRYRRQLNPDHHQHLPYNLEDLRQVASELMDFLYGSHLQVSDFAQSSHMSRE